MTKEEAQKELSYLSEQIDTLIDNRQMFIEDNMHLFADFDLDQLVMNKDTLQLGKVISHYQATYGQPPKSLHHSSFDVGCCIEIQDKHKNKLIANTSHNIGRHPWMDYKEWIEKMKLNLI